MGKCTCKTLTRQRVVSVGNVHGLWVRYTWLDLMALVPLPLSVPHKQTKHGHDDEEEKDDAHDSPCWLALGASCWTDLCVWVQLFHHQSCYRESRKSGSFKQCVHICVWAIIPRKASAISITSHLDRSGCLYSQGYSSMFQSHSHR